MGRKTFRSAEAEMEISGIWVFSQGPIYGVSLVGDSSKKDTARLPSEETPRPGIKLPMMLKVKGRSDKAFN